MWRAVRVRLTAPSKRYEQQTFGAHFCEIGVDAWSGEIGLVSAAASAQSSSAQFKPAPSISRFSSGNHEGINSESGGADLLAIESEGGFADRSEMTPTKRRQLDALYREVLQRKAENGGALTNDDPRFLTRKARGIVRANGF